MLKSPLVDQPVHRRTYVRLLFDILREGNSFCLRHNYSAAGQRSDIFVVPELKVHSGVSAERRKLKPGA
jgi:hypothetical protein